MGTLFSLIEVLRNCNFLVRTKLHNGFIQSLYPSAGLLNFPRIIISEIVVGCVQHSWYPHLVAGFVAGNSESLI